MKRNIRSYSLSVIAAVLAGTTIVSVNSNDFSLLSSAEETAVIPCVIYYEHEDYTTYFLKEMKLSDTENEYETRQALRVEYETSGKFSDEELEKKRQEYCNNRIRTDINKLLENVIKQGSDEPEMNISEYNSAYLLKEHRENVVVELALSEEQFTAAKTELKPRAYVVSASEKEKIGTKIHSYSLLEDIRNGKELHGIKIVIDGKYAGTTDSDLEKYVKENLPFTEFISVSEAYNPVLGSIYPYSVNVSATTEQIELLCQTDSVLSIREADVWPMPTVEPVDTETPEPTTVPFDPGTPMPTSAPETAEPTTIPFDPGTPMPTSAPETPEPTIVPFDPGTPMPTHTATPVSPLPTNKDGLIYGDLNKDDVVDVSDLTLLSLVLLGDTKETDHMKVVADFDGDGSLTLADLARLRQYLSKKIDKLC